MDAKTMLKTLCEASGVNGETSACEVAKTLLSAYTNDIRTDALGNVIGYLPSANPDAPTLLLEAHIDEIGFVVTGVDSHGFVHVANCGGIDNRALAAGEIVFVTEPPVYGVFCSTPPHLTKADDPLPDLTDRGVDVGLTKEEAEVRLPLGTRAVYRPHFDELLNNRVSTKAADNRAGVAAVLGALECVKGKDLPVNIVVSFSVQEEVGMRGAQPAAFGVMPDAAIVVDVSFAHTHDVSKEKYASLGKGPMVGQAPVLDKELTEQLFALAETQGVPVQHEVMGGKTGTDADVIGVVGHGVPCTLVSIPLKYMHTPIEVVSLDDLDATSRLMAAFILNGEVSIHA